jgi:hypothetical protein
MLKNTLFEKQKKRFFKSRKKSPKKETPFHGGKTPVFIRVFWSKRFLPKTTKKRTFPQNLEKEGLKIA